MEHESLLAKAAARLIPGQILPASALPGLQAEAGLPDTDALMQALLPVAQALARPPISGFRVGAIGQARETGDLILGANLEFPSANPSDTVHAEQFLFSRAHHLGLHIARMAVSARPCGHCRQFMKEFSESDRLTILDAEAGPLALADLLPFSFGPAELGYEGADAAARQPLELVEDARLTEPAMLAALIAAGERAHSPYSGAPVAIALVLADGTIVTGSAIENAAYNPGLPPVQAALINLLASGRDYHEIESALIGYTPDASFCYSTATARLLAIIAPGALLERVSWRRRGSS